MHAIGLLAFVALAPAALLAQSPRLAEAHVVLPTTLHLSGATASGDVDGDGLVDRVFCPTGTVWFGRADGSFAAVENSFTPQPYTSLESPSAVLGDFDGDGDLDACVPEPHSVFGSGFSQMVFGGALAIYSNDGAGLYTQTGSLGFPLTAGVHTTAVAAGDVDGDGDLDLVSAVEPVVMGASTGTWSPPTFWTSPGQDHLWLNDGGGGFTDATNLLPAVHDFTRRVTLRDFDTDGDLDIFFANRTFATSGGFDSGPQAHRVCLNNGTGRFTSSWTMSSGAAVLAVHAGDFDQDGDVDVLLHEVPQARLLTNQGNATFAASTPPLASIPAHGSIAADFDNDGRLDYGIHTQDSWLRTVRNTPGSFVADPTGDLFLGDAPAQRLFLTDFENDGDVDLVASADSLARSRLWRNVGSRPWQLVTTDVREEALGFPAMAVADLDADGHPDLLLGPGDFPSPLSGARWYRNDGHGGLVVVASGAFGSIPGNATDIDVGDLDGDGDLDVLVAANPPQLGRNVGGQFMVTPLNVPASMAFTLGDLDGDGDLDAYGSSDYVSLQYDVVLTNQGNGTFAVAATALPPTTRSRRVQLVDLNHDGALDVLALSPVFALRNDGTGRFATMTAGMSLGEDSAAAADFDGDGDVDVVVGSLLYRNEGAGTFVAAASGVPTATLARVHLFPGDFDGDGDVDLVRSRDAAMPDATLLTNDGSGFFTVQAGAIAGLQDFSALEVVDLDGDGDHDLVAAAGVPRIYRNRQRQLSWRTLPRVGWPLILDLEARANDLYALAVAFAPAHLPVPGLGVLRLDPASLALVAWNAVDAQGKSVFQATVPLAPSLVGLTLYWQAISGAPGTLGNLETTTFLAH